MDGGQYREKEKANENEQSVLPSVLIVHVPQMNLQIIVLRKSLTTQVARERFRTTGNSAKNGKRNTESAYV
jgi:hypothetical protein